MALWARSRGGRPVVRHLLLQPDLTEVGRARQFLRDVAWSCGLSADRVFDVTVACSEALANAIEHDVSRSRSTLKTLVYPDRLEVQIDR